MVAVSMKKRRMSGLGEEPVTHLLGGGEVKRHSHRIRNSNDVRECKIAVAIG
jgi:hypothetical protein